MYISYIILFQLGKFRKVPETDAKIMGKHIKRRKNDKNFACGGPRAQRNSHKTHRYPGGDIFLRISQNK